MEILKMKSNKENKELKVLNVISILNKIILLIKINYRSFKHLWFLFVIKRILISIDNP